MKLVVAASLVAAAAGFQHMPYAARAAARPATVVVNGAGKYDGQLWDMTAKIDVWNMWDPNSPRSETNFNPFERNPDGNACDCSGYFPGEGKYKDPMRPDMNFQKMMEEKEQMAQIEANPKPGDVPGAPGRLS